MFLIGFMGAGKTTVGRLLAGRLGRPFVDLDEVIAIRAGRSIPEIFAAEGEARFRQREAEALDAASGSEAIVAVGGGAPAWGDNLARMRAAGPVIHLSADVKTLLQRLNTADGIARRPLLAGAAAAGNLPEQIAALQARRAAAYAQADLVIDTRGADPNEVAERTLAALHRAGRVQMDGMGTIERIHVSGPTPYPIVVDAGPVAEERLATALREALPGVGCLAVLTDETVARLQLPRLTPVLATRGFRPVVVAFPPGEGSKRLAMVERIACEFLTGGVDRDSALLAFGGGVVSDLGGFVAATLLRGLPWAVAPTTLLSQVDAAIGGKTGVNLPVGKNLVGAFYPPRLVYADLGTLATLPPRDRRAGLGEVVKHALLVGEDMLSLLEEHAARIAAGDPALLGTLVVRSCRYKAQVVAADPYERQRSGGRAVLNLGHTLGHAIEAATADTDEPLQHGEAVGLGLLATARISARLGLAPAQLEERLTCLLARLGLPTQLDRILNGPLRPRITAALGVDKKRIDHAIRFIALEGPGRPRVVPLDLASLLSLLQLANDATMTLEELP